MWHLFVISVKNRDELQRYLSDHGIQTLIHYPIPPHLQEAYTSLDYKMGDFPITEEFSNTCLSLPLWPGMVEEDLETIVQLLNKI
ncbi:dTDP-3-amino-3,6-dideoxy-alpha-D-galactopyranose transaminase [compost metagenome]